MWNIILLMVLSINSRVCVIWGQFWLITFSPHFGLYFLISKTSFFFLFERERRRVQVREREENPTSDREVGLMLTRPELSRCRAHVHPQWVSVSLEVGLVLTWCRACAHLIWGLCSPKAGHNLTGCAIRTHQLWDHHLSRSQMLNNWATQAP